MNAYEFTLSLRIRHPGIDPAEISSALGIEPQHTWKAGEPRRGPAEMQFFGNSDEIGQPPEIHRIVATVRHLSEHSRERIREIWPECLRVLAHREMTQLFHDSDRGALHRTSGPHRIGRRTG